MDWLTGIARCDAKSFAILTAQGFQPVKRNMLVVLTRARLAGKPPPRQALAGARTGLLGQAFEPSALAARCRNAFIALSLKLSDVPLLFRLFLIPPKQPSTPPQHSCCLVRCTAEVVV